MKYISYVVLALLLLLVYIFSGHHVVKPAPDNTLQIGPTPSHEVIPPAPQGKG